MDSTQHLASRPCPSSSERSHRPPGSSDRPRSSQEGLEVVQAQAPDDGIQVVFHDDGIQVAFHESKTNSRMYPQRATGREEKEAIPQPNNATKPRLQIGLATATPNLRWEAFLKWRRILVLLIIILAVVPAIVTPLVVIFKTRNNARESNM